MCKLTGVFRRIKTITMILRNYLAEQPVRGEHETFRTPAISVILINSVTLPDQVDMATCPNIEHWYEWNVYSAAVELNHVWYLILKILFISQIVVPNRPAGNRDGPGGRLLLPRWVWRILPSPLQVSISPSLSPGVSLRITTFLTPALLCHRCFQSTCYANFAVSLL